MKKLRVPLLNANEDQLLVAAVHVEEGEQVQAGQLLFGLESTKAVTDVEAPCAGFVRNLAVAEDDRVEVGFVLCVLTETADEAIPAEATAASGGSSVKATRKARELAETHGVDLQSLSVSGIIKEKDVLAAVGGVAASNREWKDPVEGPNGLVVWGAGGHAKVLLDILRAGHPDLTAIGLVDDAPSGPSEVLGTPVIGKSDRLAGLRDSGVARAALGVGAVTKNSLRVELYERLVELRFQLPNLIHPRAMVEPSATMGQGNQIFAGAVVGSSAVLRGQRHRQQRRRRLPRTAASVRTRT